MLAEDDDTYCAAARWLRAGRGVVLARVIETFGSAPRPAGSPLVVCEDGLFLGSVSTGCVEGDVITAALEVIATGAPQRLDFGSVEEETVWRPGLSCGGRIAVLVERLDAGKLQVFAAARRERAAGRRAVVASPLAGGEARLYCGAELFKRPPGWSTALGAGASRIAAIEDEDWFLHVFEPAPRLLLIGAVHVAQSLAPMARAAGFDVTIVDPRSAFAAPERFPGEKLDARWPDEALADLGLDAATAVAALSHDAKIDDCALRLALESPCFYVGAMGSRATNARRRARLDAAGVSAKALARLEAPIGVDIGALGPAEIAVAALASIVRARGRKPLREAS